ncbi:MAG: hypothetical protein KDD64_00875 [Bdellovibrionales bacterium]|nr:hypothetical protein [Bdellovibrionales bacterium]
MENSNKAILLGLFVYEEIEKLAKEHETSPFPLGHRSIRVGELSLTALQSEILGYVFSFLNTGGGLGSRQKIALKRCYEQVESVKGEMSEEGRVYFERLVTLAKKVDTLAHDQPKN